MHFLRAPLPCASDERGRDRVAKAAVLAGAKGVLSPCARSRSAAVTKAAPAAFARPGKGNRASGPYREHQQEKDERRKYQREIAADGKELQDIKPIGRAPHESGNRRV